MAGSRSYLRLIGFYTFALLLAILVYNQYLSLQIYSHSTAGMYQQTNLAFPIRRVTDSQNASINVIDPQKKTNTTHMFHVAAVGLLDWEREVIEQGTCHGRPATISPSCCLGTFNRGGGLVINQPKGCLVHGKVPFDRVQELALQHVRTTDHWIQQPNNATKCDVCHILEILRDRNLTLTFSGDSLQNQVVDGFLCELQRRNYAVQIVTTEDRGKDCKGFDCIISFTIYEIHSPLWHDKDTVTIKWFYNYQVPFKNPNDTNLVLSSGGVYFFNYGLHYRPEVSHKYETNLVTYLDTVKNYTNWKLLLFRETSAQHFNIPGGDFLGWSRPKPWFDSDSCTPHRPAPTQGFREVIFKNAALHAGFVPLVMDSTLQQPPPIFHGDTREIVILPYYNFTAQLHDLHIISNINTAKNASEYKGECTHFCSTPFLWLPLWRSFRLAMDRQFPSMDL